MSKKIAFTLHDVSELRNITPYLGMCDYLDRRPNIIAFMHTYTISLEYIYIHDIPRRLLYNLVRFVEVGNCEQYVFNYILKLSNTSIAYHHILSPKHLVGRGTRVRIVGLTYKNTKLF